MTFKILLVLNLAFSAFLFYCINVHDDRTEQLRRQVEFVKAGTAKAMQDVIVIKRGLGI